MRKTIWKYDVPMEDYFEIDMPKDAQILTVQTQNGEPKLWALVNLDITILEKRKFRHSGTGHPITDDNMDYIGTYQLHGGGLIFHVFEVK